MSQDGSIPASSQSIINIVKEIENGTLVLPEFQRDFVWTVEQTLDLFDSLVKRIHIGSLIYGKPKFEITVREFNKFDRKIKKTSKEYLSEEEKQIHFLSEDKIKRQAEINKAYTLVLDGQQRITSIYRAVVKGVDDIWFIATDDRDLIQTCKSEKRSLEELLDHFSTTQDRDQLSIKLSDVFEMAEDDDECKMQLFNKLDFAKKMDEESERKMYFDAYRYLFIKISDLFKAENLVSYFLLDMNMDKFVLFFERSNSKAVALNFIDILVAKVYNGFKLRKAIKDFNVDHEYELIPEVPVRAIAYIVSGGHEIDKNFVLQKLTADDFNKYWKDITTAYENVVNYLRKNSYIDTLKELPYANMLLTLVIFANSFPSKSLDEMNEKQKDVIDWWYWSVSFSKHYTSASNEAIMLDCNCLLALVNKVNSAPRYDKFFMELRPRFTDASEIEELNVSRNPIYLGIMGLLRKENQGIINWTNGACLASTKVDSHHIFPQKYLSSNNISNDQIDRVANRVIISTITNIKIGKKAPSIYLKELQNNHETIASSLKKCCIPDTENLLSGYLDNKYDIFLKERSAALFKLIQDRVVSKSEWVKKYCNESISYNETLT